MTSAAEAPAVLTLNELTLQLPNGRRLLNRAAWQVRAGQFVLFVGPSGSGKSTLLRIIAGLRDEDDEFTVEGEINVGELGKPPPDRIGLVFQNHALFDELSAVDNVRFALDHRRHASPNARSEARALLEQLHVPIHTPLSRLSGGERQRVAVARTLALDPPLLLFDEPTTGLDPARARAVAELIAETHRRSGKTVIVVTHDYAPFLTFRPRIVLVDVPTGQLRDVTAEQLRESFEHRTPAPPVAHAAAPSARPRPGWERLLERPGQVLLTLLLALPAACGGWRTPRWKLRYLWHYLRMVCLGSTAIYVALAGLMLGFVFTTFSFAQLPYSRVTVPLLTEEFLAATGYSTYRVVVPLMIAVLMAGKCGAAVAADVGARRLTHQFDAMRSLGARPSAYLYGNIALALIVSAPLLTLLAFAANCYAALVAFLMTSDETSVAMFRRNFFSMLWPASAALPGGTGWVMLKAVTSGLTIAALAYAIGARRKVSSVDVSRGVSLTIFWATLAVLALHSFYSFIEF